MKKGGHPRPLHTYTGDNKRASLLASQKKTKKQQQCNILEDEFHSVLECRIYKDLRSKYIPVKYWRRSSMSKLIELLDIQNHEIIRNLGTYIWNAFKKRSEIMYDNV